MITDFKLFGPEHIMSLLTAIIIGIVFILLAKKYSDKKKTISIILAITIVLIRFIRYGFDIYINDFKILDLISIHICHINLILLVICLIKPNNKLFAFNFLVGIPTALAVALLPGQNHAEPGMLRAIFFIMSHMMLVMGAIYELIIYKLKIEKKDLLTYYVVSFIGIIIVYTFDKITNLNFMYLTKGPSKTVLETLYNTFGQYGYLVLIYLLLVILFTLFYIIYKIIIKKIDNKKNKIA